MNIGYLSKICVFTIFLTNFYARLLYALLFLETITEKGVIFLFKPYIKTRVLVTIILVTAAILLVAAMFIREADTEEREFRGTFVQGGVVGGHIYQA